MNPSDRARLCWLIDALAEGWATADDLRELERLAGTPVGRRVYLTYVLMLGELHWGAVFMAGAPQDHLSRPLSPSPAETVVERSGPKILEVSQAGPAARGFTRVFALRDRNRENARQRPVFRRYALFGVAVGAVAVFLSAVFLVARFSRQPSPESLRPQRSVAVQAGAFEARFEKGPEELGELVPGERVEIKTGLAAWHDSQGNRWVLEGPAHLEVRDAGRLLLERGNLVVQLGEKRQQFRVETPHAQIVDRGTAFAVQVTDVATEVHVLSGEVAVCPQTDKTSTPAQLVRAGEAVAVGYGGQAVRIDWRGHEFWTEMPKWGSAAALRFLAMHDPRFWFSVTFEDVIEGAGYLTRGERFTLVPVRMRGTFVPMRPEFETGYAGLTKAATILRGRTEGNIEGLGWQTDSPVIFPREFTCEVVFRFDGWPDGNTGRVGCILATRAGVRECGFLLGAIPPDDGGHDRGILVHLLDGDADWTLTRGRLMASRWYYAACVFEAFPQEGHVFITTYLAELSPGGSLTRVYSGKVPGKVPSGPLGIGKGFDVGLAHSYPFPGALDEVYLYNGKLEEEVLRRHVELLIGKPDLSAGMPLPE